MRFLALLAILWAGAWLLLIAMPGGEVGVLDRGYDLMLRPFGHIATDTILRRLIEFVCLLPAAALLVMAQAVHRRRLDNARDTR